MSSPAPLRHSAGLCVYFHWVHCEFGTEQTVSHTPKQQHNIQLIFKIKHSMSTPAQKSHLIKYEHLFQSFSREPFMLWCLQLIPMTVFPPIYVINLGTPWSLNSNWPKMESMRVAGWRRQSKTVPELEHNRHAVKSYSKIIQEVHFYYENINIGTRERSSCIIANLMDPCWS